MNQALPIARKQRSILRWLANFTLIIGLMAVAILSVYAVDAGDLDPAFSGDGIATVNFGDVGDYGYDMALQTDGKVVIVGKSFNGANDDFALARLNPDGSPDTSFGTNGNGTVKTDFNSSNDSASGVAIQADGKLVVAGSSTAAGTSDFAVARYNSDGSLDTTFDTDGKVTTDIDTEIDYANDVAIDSNGRIVVVGYYENNIYDDGAIVRYNSDGSLDGNFAAGGIYKTDAQWGEFHAVVIDGAGKIVTVGPSFTVWRFNSDGSLDTGFDGDGKFSGNPSDFNDFSRDLAIYPGGKIVVAGWSSCCPDDRISVIRVNNNGTFDTSFDGDGVAQATFDGGDVNIYTMAVDTSGRIIVGGDFQPGSTGSDYNFALARFNPNGSLDTTFSFDGKVTTSLGLAEDRIHGLAVTTNDLIIVAGHTINGIDNDFAAAQYHAISTIPTSTPTDIPTITPTQEPFTELLTNTSFEVDVDNDKVPDGWTGKNLLGDKLLTNKPDKVYAYDGVKAFRFKGSTGENSKIQYKISGSALSTTGAGDTLELSAWIKEGLGGANKSVAAKVKYADDSKLKVELDLPLSPANTDYQQFTQEGILTNNVANIKVMVSFKGIIGRKMQVDLISLKLIEGTALSLNDNSSLLPLP